MFDFIFGNSYIVVRNKGKLYLTETYSELVSKINDSNSTIEVRVLDPFTGFFDDVRVINKSDIVSYGSN